MKRNRTNESQDGKDENKQWSPLRVILFVACFLIVIVASSSCIIARSVRMVAELLVISSDLLLVRASRCMRERSRGAHHIVIMHHRYQKAKTNQVSCNYFPVTFLSTTFEDNQVCDCIVMRTVSQVVTAFEPS